MFQCFHTLTIFLNLYNFREKRVFRESTFEGKKKKKLTTVKVVSRKILSSQRVIHNLNDRQFFITVTLAATRISFFSTFRREKRIDRRLWPWRMNVSCVCLYKWRSGYLSVYLRAREEIIASQEGINSRDETKRDETRVYGREIDNYET